MVHFLYLNFYKGFPQLSGFMSLGEEKLLRSLKYSYELILEDKICWVARSNNRREFSPKQLADEAIKAYLEIAEKNRL